MMRSQKRKIYIGLLYFSVFMFFVIWFSVLHPIRICDTDDWTYLSIARAPIPLKILWNPSRIFAEVIFPTVSQISAIIYRTVTSRTDAAGILDAMTMGWAVCVAVSMTALFIAIRQIFMKFSGKPSLSLVLALQFLIMHFWIMCKGDNSSYMLMTNDACTYFYYVIPNILNCFIVLWYYSDSELHYLFKKEAVTKKAVFLVVFYYSVFSNIWASIIVCALLGTELLFSLVNAFRKKFRFRSIIEETYTTAILLFVWFTSNLYEMNGGRAGSIPDNTVENMKVVIKSLIGLKSVVNTEFKKYVVLVLLLFLVITLVMRKKKEVNLKYFEALGKITMCFLICAVYLILTCSRSITWYITRPDVFYCLFFYGSLFILACTYRVLETMWPIKLIYPWFLVFVILTCNSYGVTYKGLPVERNRVSVDIIRQVQEAEQQGRATTKVYIPDFGSEYWPYALYANDRIANAIYKLGLTERYIGIEELIPDRQKNIDLNVG